MLTVYDLLKICVEFEKRAQYTALDTILTPKERQEQSGYYGYRREQIPFQRYVNYKNINPEFPIPEKEPKKEEKQVDPYDPSTTLPLPGIERPNPNSNQGNISSFKLPEIEPYHVQTRQETPGPSYHPSWPHPELFLDEAKALVLKRYNDLKKSLSILLEKYKEANQRAAEAPEIDVENLSLIETVKYLADYCLNRIRVVIGQMFGSELSTNSSLFRFLTKDFNIFDITNNNVNFHIDKFDRAEQQIKEIIEHYEKLKRLEKHVVKNVRQAVEEFLSDQKNVDILSWTDQYNPQAKEDIVDDMKKSLIKYRWRRRSSWERERDDFSLNDLRSVRTFKEIYEKLSQSLTSRIKEKAITRGESYINDVVASKIQSIIDEYVSKFSWLKEYKRELKPDEIFSKLKVDLKETLGLDIGSVEQYLKIISSKKPAAWFGNSGYNVNTIIEVFKLKFIDNVKSFFADRIKYVQRDCIVNFFRDFNKKSGEADTYSSSSKGLIGQDIKKFLAEQDFESFVREQLLKEIVGIIPGVAFGASYFPQIHEIKDILSNYGSISFRTIIDSLKQSAPELPNDLLVQFVKYLFREDKLDFLNKIKNEADQFKFLIKLLSKLNKLDINNLTKLMPKFIDIVKVITEIYTDLPQDVFTKDIVDGLLLKSIRNVDTIIVDLKNIQTISKIIHNEGGRLSPEMSMSLFNNTNAVSIDKVAGVKKLYKAIISIANAGGPKGLKKQYGPLVVELVKSKLIGRNIYRNMQFLLDFFNSNKSVNPSSQDFSDLFRITSEVETDLDTVLMSNTYKDFLKDYEPKNPELFKLDYKINDRLRFRVLKDKDPRHLRIGIETNCCQRIGGVGETAAVDSFVNPLAGVLILEWLDEGAWKLLSQSYFHYVPEENGYILDNVEGNNKNIKDSKIYLPSVYAWYANKLKKKLKFNYFLAGKGYTELDANKFDTDKRKEDNRDFSDKALINNRTDHYSDYDEENSSDLTKPKFKLKDLDPKSWGQTSDQEKEIENKIASSISDVRRMILRSYLIAA